MALRIQQRKVRHTDLHEMKIVTSDVLVLDVTEDGSCVEMLSPMKYPTSCSEAGQLENCCIAYQIGDNASLGNVIAQVRHEDDYQVYEDSQVPIKANVTEFTMNYYFDDTAYPWRYDQYRNPPLLPPDAHSRMFIDFGIEALSRPNSIVSGLCAVLYTYYPNTDYLLQFYTDPNYGGKGVTYGYVEYSYDETVTYRGVALDISNGIDVSFGGAKALMTHEVGFPFEGYVDGHLMDGGIVQTFANNVKIHQNQYGFNPPYTYTRNVKFKLTKQWNINIYGYRFNVWLQRSDYSIDYDIRDGYSYIYENFIDDIKTEQGVHSKIGCFSGRTLAYHELIGVPGTTDDEYYYRRKGGDNFTIFFTGDPCALVYGYGTGKCNDAGGAEGELAYTGQCQAREGSSGTFIRSESYEFLYPPVYHRYSLTGVPFSYSIYIEDLDSTIQKLHDWLAPGRERLDLNISLVVELKTVWLGGRAGVEGSTYTNSHYRFAPTVIFAVYQVNLDTQYRNYYRDVTYYAGDGGGDYYNISGGGGGADVPIEPYLLTTVMETPIITNITAKATYTHLLDPMEKRSDADKDRHELVHVVEEKGDTTFPYWLGEFGDTDHYLDNMIQKNYPYRGAITYSSAFNTQEIPNIAYPVVAFPTEDNGGVFGRITPAHDPRPEFPVHQTASTIVVHNTRLLCLFCKDGKLNMSANTIDGYEEGRNPDGSEGENYVGWERTEIITPDIIPDGEEDPPNFLYGSTFVYDDGIYYIGYADGAVYPSFYYDSGSDGYLYPRVGDDTVVKSPTGYYCVVGRLNLDTNVYDWQKPKIVEFDVMPTDSREYYNYETFNVTVLDDGILQIVTPRYQEGVSASPEPVVYQSRGVTDDGVEKFYKVSG